MLLESGKMVEQYLQAHQLLEITYRANKLEKLKWEPEPSHALKDGLDFVAKIEKPEKLPVPFQPWNERSSL